MTDDLARCDREIADAIAGQSDPNLDERLGALRGEMDWRAERQMLLRAPFPWFGGKSRVAHLVWDRFGNVPNYVEPFAGSLAVLLARPHAAKNETANDRDAYLANFWRATQRDPEQVAFHADWPINEADLHARHCWLVAQADFRERMLADPDYFDAKTAGWQRVLPHLPGVWPHGDGISAAAIR